LDHWIRRVSERGLVNVTHEIVVYEVWEIRQSLVMWAVVSAAAQEVVADENEKNSHRRENPNNRSALSATGPGVIDVIDKIGQTTEHTS